MISEETIRNLIAQAITARENSYSPYSHYQVGAALLAEDGQIILGCNIENAAYTPTNCAERTAFFKAVSEGVYEFLAIAVVGGLEDAKELDFCAPCGVCRQVMMEFCCPETFRILLARSEDEYREYRLQELLPMGFGAGNLRKENTK